MRTLIMIIGIFCLIPGVYSQNDSIQPVMTAEEQKELAREYKAAERKAEAERLLKETEYMINQHKFVLEADYLSNRTGNRCPVSSNLNFIKVDSAKAIIQIGSASGIGYNGVGGITVDGTVTKYEASKIVKKKGTSFSVTFYVLSSLGTYDIQLWVTGSGSADATIRGTTAGSLSYSGRLVRPEESRIYKGSSL